MPPEVVLSSFSKTASCKKWDWEGRGKVENVQEREELGMFSARAMSTPGTQAKHAHTLWTFPAFPL